LFRKIKIHKKLRYIDLKETIRIALYAVLFFAVFISASMFLNSRENSRPTHVVVLMKNIDGIPIIKRIQTTGSSADCIATLMNNLQSRSIELREVGKRLDKCFSLGLSESSNNTGIKPRPQGNDENTPRFV